MTAPHPREWILPSGHFSVLECTEDLLVVNKPAGWLNGRTPLAPRDMGLLELAELQLGAYAPVKLHPVHRLDRATSGILLMARNPTAAARWSEAFRNQALLKTYIAVVRGWCEDTGEIDKPLERSPGHEARPAITRYQTIHRIEVPVSLSPRHSTTRYSIVRVHPLTGRNHQIRRHFSSISHPLIGDTTYGEGRHNRFFRENYGFSHLGLHAETLETLPEVTHLAGAWRADIPLSWDLFLNPWGLTRESLTDSAKVR